VFQDTYKTTPNLFTKIYNGSDEAALNNDINVFKSLFQTKEMNLITKLSENCSSNKIAAIKALNNYKALIELDGDS